MKRFYQLVYSIIQFIVPIFTILFIVFFIVTIWNFNEFWMKLTGTTLTILMMSAFIGYCLSFIKYGEEEDEHPDELDKWTFDETQRIY